MTSRLSRLEVVGPLVAGALLLVALLRVWAGRFGYPYDLEWMEGGMLAHAWRLDRGLPLYVRPNLDFVPYVYPPGYSALVALLGKVVGLSMPLGRFVSIVSILTAAGTLGWAVARSGGNRLLTLTAPLVFLGTYPMVGAFYDLVRPDSLAVALLGGSLALSLDTRRPRAPVWSGLLLAAAFLAKQNTAIFGVPILLALMHRDRRDALRFAAASIGPALVAIGVLQWWSGGNFLVWMVEVPRSHVAIWARARRDVPIEWGTALPLAFAAVGARWVLDAITRQRAIPAPIAAAIPIWFGMAAVAWGIRETSPAFAPLPAGVAYWAMAAGPLALGVLAVGWGLERLRVAGGGGEGGSPLPSWEWTWEVGTVLVGGISALTMRVHDSGWVNVHAPFFWTLTLVTARVLARSAAVSPVGGAPVGIRWQGVISAALTLQLLWGWAHIRPSELVPTARDLEAGDQLVREIEKVDGPVLSPFGAWTPTYAGKPPSLHAMGLWDSNYPGGPYFEDLAIVEQGLETHHWKLIIGGNQPMIGEFVRYYEPVKELVPERDPALNPKTGYRVRPWRLLVPKGGRP